jgi:hypothetical protein
MFVVEVAPAGVCIEHGLHRELHRSAQALGRAAERRKIASRVGVGGLRRRHGEPGGDLSIAVGVAIA